MTLQRQQRRAAIGQSCVVIGFQRQCLVEGCHGLLMTLQMLQSAAPIVEGVGRVGVDLYCLPNETFCVFKTALLELNETEKIERLKIARGLPQHGAVEPRGFLEVARLMLAHRMGKQSVVHGAGSPTAKLPGASPRAVRSRIAAKADSRLRVKRAVSKS